ncbi:hypothetical protein Tco_0977299 [Tanacetum coccineum]|uniref:Uncharacterized protein n=1 Tax=Tanacetum coccineum TaxID=301880 RepID=A0ABQ5EK60_9ASTR
MRSFEVLSSGLQQVGSLVILYLQTASLWIHQKVEAITKWPRPTTVTEVKCVIQIIDSDLHRRLVSTGVWSFVSCLARLSREGESHTFKTVKARARCLALSLRLSFEVWNVELCVTNMVEWWLLVDGKEELCPPRHSLYRSREAITTGTVADCLVRRQCLISIDHSRVSVWSTASALRKEHPAARVLLPTRFDNSTFGWNWHAAKMWLRLYPNDELVRGKIETSEASGLKEYAIWVVVDRITKSASFSYPFGRTMVISKLAKDFSTGIVRLRWYTDSIVSARDMKVYRGPFRLRRYVEGLCFGILSESWTGLAGMIFVLGEFAYQEIVEHA